MNNWRIASYASAQRCAAFFAKVLKATWQGFWLGLLDSNSLNQLTSSFYGDSGHLTSREHNLAGFFPWENTAIQQFFPKGARVLVGACGGGREIVALHQHGYQVDAFDCCAPLVESCRALVNELNIPARVLVSQPDHIPEEFASYDAAIFGWGAWSHIAGRNVRLKFLHDFRVRLAPGAPLLLSCVTSDTSTREARYIHALARMGRFVSGVREPIERGDYLLSGAFWHHFSREEIERELAEGGFTPAYYHTDGYLAHVVGLATSDF